ncbi:MAG: ankyrin repeat domain-containing protein [Gammaproteobacteria bacterium]|jgi:ankyrin repeat protein|nr:ankyrin repeat domain-containing protein [Gammaproteobacteria bacterium]
MGDSPKSSVPEPIIPKPELKPGSLQVDSPVQIQNVLVTGDLVPVPGPLKIAKTPLGEFGVVGVNTNDQTTRLFTHIKGLVDIAATEHKKQNCDNTGKLKKECENNIVRLVTNEFSFFTAKPLTIDEFQSLHAEIVKLAALQPQNLQLLLSSFAVKTADNKLLNIVAQVECGNPPKVQCFAKNQFSAIDPVYYDVDAKGAKTLIPYITKAEMVKKLGADVTPKINLKGIDIGFSSVFECTTAGKAKFISCIDICLDHKLSIAKAELQSQLQSATNKAKQTKPSEELPIQVSHVLSSHSIGMHPDNAVGNVTHADPYQTPVISPDYTQTLIVGKPTFGTPVRIAMTTQKPCSLLPPAQMNLVQQHTNEINQPHSTSRALDYIKNTLTTNGENASLSLSQKQENAERCVSQSIASIDSLDELQKLFEHIETQSKVNDNKAGPLQYLRKNKDDSLGFPPRYENMCHYIQSRALEIATKNNSLNHPLLKTLSDYDKNFVITTASNDKLDAAILNNAVRNEKVSQVTELLKTTSANLCDTNGDFPIHVAIIKGNENILEILLQKNASPNVQNKNKQTPLEIAISNNNIRMVEQLLKNGASANMICSEGSTPLTFSIINNKPEMIDLLVRHGANLNARDNNKLLPIEAVYQHAKNDKYTQLNKLFTLGAKPTLADFAGKSFVQHALTIKDLNLLNVLSNRILFSNDEIIKHNEIKNGAAPKPVVVAPAKPIPAKSPDVAIVIKSEAAPIPAPASRGILGSIADAFSSVFGSEPAAPLKPLAPPKSAAKPEDHVVVDIELKPLPPKVLNASNSNVSKEATFLPSKAPKSNASENERTPFIPPKPIDNTPGTKPKDTPSSRIP